MESPPECVLLIVGPALLSALWPWPGMRAKKALTPHSGEGIESSTGYQQWHNLWLKITENTIQNGLNNKEPSHLM